MTLFIYRKGVEKPRKFEVTPETLQYFVLRCCNPFANNIIEIMTIDHEIHILDKNDVVGYDVRN